MVKTKLDEGTITLVGGSIGTELYRRALVRLGDVEQTDAVTWLITLAIDGIGANVDHETLCAYAAELAQRYGDTSLDFAHYVDRGDYEQLRQKNGPGGEAVAKLGREFCARHEVTYQRAVRRL